MRNSEFGIRNGFRKRSLLALLLIFCLLLTGCHGGGNKVAFPLPREFDTGDLIIVLLLLLLAGDCEEERNTALLTLALYFFL